MIIARTRRIIQGADYSAQEPRVLTQLCEDPSMLKAYMDRKDLYVEIAAISFDRPYKYCLEHFPKNCPIKQNSKGKWEYARLKSGEDDGKLKFEDLIYDDINPEDYDYDKLSDGETDVFKEGKEYRGQAKRILLGIMYGRGEKSIAEQLGCTVDEAKAIKNSVYTAFPYIKKFEIASNEKVRQFGFVSTLWGRKRRLPEFNLPKYQISYIDDNGNIMSTPVPQAIKDEITEKLEAKVKAKAYREVDRLIALYNEKKGIQIIDNGSRIAAAGRQIINAQVQGSAADMSKLALIKIDNDVELKKRKVIIIIPVHDEILIETPLRYASFVKKQFSMDMETAARPRLTIPISCDVVSSERWTGEELDINEELKGLEEV